MSLTHPSILDHASTWQLEQAAACNHTELFCRNAVARGGEVRVMDAITYTYEGVDHQSMIAFPSLQEWAADEQLDEMMRWYAIRPNRGLGCWSLDPPRPADLGVRLKARGFQDGWRPCWMGLDMSGPAGLGPAAEGYTGLGGGEVTVPVGVEIKADNGMSLLDVKDLPYTGRHGAISPELLQRHPELAHQFIAILKGKIVGHCTALFTTGEYGVTGIYDVAVVPSARGKGIGKTLVLAACRKGKDNGFRYAVLNATGQHMYEQIGFQWISDGFTWWWFPKNS
jgi:GNAT superfamily N-acetyltransferase